MPVLGVTGGIATGKSSFVRALTGEFPGRVFDADRAAHELLAGDLEVHRAVADAFGAAALDAQGRPDRAKLRKLVFDDPGARKRLESILHPVIRRSWEALAEQHRSAGEWLLVDIPLLFETEAQSRFDRIVVVACSSDTQRARLRQQRGLDDALIEKIVGAQLPLGLKMQQADHVVWNDSTPACLTRQAHLLAGLLCNLYG